MAEEATTTAATTTPQHWLDASPDYAEFAKDPDTRKHLESYKTPKDQLKAHVELQKQFAKSFRIPDQLDSLPETERTTLVSRIGKILGAREKPEEYELTRPTMPDGLGYDEDAENALRAWAVKHHVPQSAVADLYTDHNTRMTSRYEADIKEHNDEYAKVEQALATKFGADAWNKQIKPGIMTLLTEFAKKTGLWKDGEKARLDLAEGLIFSKDGICTPLMAALGQLYNDLGREGVTKLTGGVPGGGDGKIDVNARWPKSANVMQV